MTNLHTKFEQALDEVNEDYKRYVATLTKDGMVPLGFKEWAALKNPQHTVWVD